jgi:hypothetical protein
VLQLTVAVAVTELLLPRFAAPKPVPAVRLQAAAIVAVAVIDTSAAAAGAQMGSAQSAAVNPIAETRATHMARDTPSTARQMTGQSKKVYGLVISITIAFTIVWTRPIVTN